MKKKYIMSELTVIDVSEKDIITTSGIIKDEDIYDNNELPDMAPED